LGGLDEGFGEGHKGTCSDWLEFNILCMRKPRAGEGGAGFALAVGDARFVTCAHVLGWRGHEQARQVQGPDSREHPGSRRTSNGRRQAGSRPGGCEQRGASSSRPGGARGVEGCEHQGCMSDGGHAASCKPCGAQGIKAAATSQEAAAAAGGSSWYS